MYVINLRFVGACITLFIVAGICAALFGKFGFQVFFLLCLYWFFRKFLSDGGTIIAILFLMVLCGLHYCPNGLLGRFDKKTS